MDGLWGWVQDERELRQNRRDPMGKKFEGVRAGGRRRRGYLLFFSNKKSLIETIEKSHHLLNITSNLL
jgi:hypothetical protein